MPMLIVEMTLKRTKVNEKQFDQGCLQKVLQ